MRELILTQLSLNDLEELIKNCVNECLKNNITEKQEPSLKFLTAKEAAQIIGVSTVTLNAWEKAGILTPVRIGTRVRYRQQDIDSVLSKEERKAA